MKRTLFGVLTLLLAPYLGYADTPPPGAVKAKLYSGDGVTPITATGTAADVRVSNPTDVSALATSAKQDTGNASTASIDGKLNSLGQKTSANSLPAVLASDQSPIGTKSPINLNGSGSGSNATVSTVTTLTAPANAVGFNLMNLEVSTTNLRWAVGRTASATLGQQLQPGRDSGFIPVGADVSIVAESGTVTYDIQWVSQ